MSSQPGSPAGSALRNRSDRLHEAIQLRALTLVLTGECAVPVLSLGRPHCYPLEVVHPPVAAVADNVEGLLRETCAAVGYIGDRRYGSISEAQGCVHVSTSAHRVRLDWVVSDERAQRVDEMTTFTGEPRSLQFFVEIPAAPIQATSVDQIASRHRAPGRAEARLKVGEERRKPPVEPDHDPVVTGPLDGVQDRSELLLGEGERLLDEDGEATF